MYRNLLVVLLLAIATSALAQNHARVKLIHALPDGEPTVNITISQQGLTVRSFFNVPYKASTNWFYLRYGSYDVAVTLNGQSVVDNTVTVNQASVVWFVAYTKGPDVVSYSDNLDSIDAGKTHLSIYHWTRNIGDIDVGVGESLDNLAQGISYFSNGGPSAFDAGQLSVSVRPSGSTAPPTAQAIFTADSQKHYLIVTVGNDNGSPAPEVIVVELTDWSIDSRLAFVHGIPADLPVSVVANSDLTIFKKINYKGITDYKNIPVGTHVITVEAQPGLAAITVTAFFNGFAEATLYAVPDGGTDAKGLLLMDDNTAPANGAARLRVLHGAVADPVDVLAGGAKVIAELANGYVSEYLPLPAMTYPISVNGAGSSNSVFSVDLTVTAGAVITVAAFGTPGDSGTTAFTLVVVTDSAYGADGNLRAVHAVAGGPIVNVKVGDLTLFGNVAYKDISSYLAVEPGLYRVSVNNADGDAELFRNPIRVDSGAYHTAIAGGSENLALFQLRDDPTPPSAGNAHLRVVHASSTSPEVGIEFAGQIVGTVAYTDVFGYIPAPGGSYVARILADKTQVFNGSLVLEADTVISVFAVGVVNNANNPFTVISAIDFDYRTPAAPAAPVAPTAPTAAPTGSTPTRTPRASSASVATASVALLALAALL